MSGNLAQKGCDSVSWPRRNRDKIFLVRASIVDKTLSKMPHGWNAAVEELGDLGRPGQLEGIVADVEVRVGGRKGRNKRRAGRCIGRCKFRLNKLNLRLSSTRFLQSSSGWLKRTSIIGEIKMT